MRTQKKTVGTEAPSRNGSRPEVVEIAEIGAMMLLRARQFKLNPHSGMRAGDVFMTRLDTRGGTWTVGETGMDADTSDACIVVTHEENDYAAKVAAYELDRLRPKFGATVAAVRRANRDGEMPGELREIYASQKAEIDRLEKAVDGKKVHRWVFRNADPLPVLRTH